MLALSSFRTVGMENANQDTDSDHASKFSLCWELWFLRTLAVSSASALGTAVLHCAETQGYGNHCQCVPLLSQALALFSLSSLNLRRRQSVPEFVKNRRY